MDYQSLHIKTVVELKKLARDMGVRVPAGTNKSALIDRLLEADHDAEAKRAAERPETVEPRPEPKPASGEEASGAAKPDGEQPAPRRRGRPPKAKPAPEADAARSPKAAPKEAARPSKVAPVGAEAAPNVAARPATRHPEAQPQPAVQKASAPPQPVSPREVGEAAGQPAPEVRAADSAATETVKATEAPQAGEKAPETKPEANSQDAVPARQRPFAVQQPGARPAGNSQRLPGGSIQRGTLRQAGGEHRLLNLRNGAEGQHKPVQRTANARLTPRQGTAQAQEPQARTPGRPNAAGMQEMPQRMIQRQGPQAGQEAPARPVQDAPRQEPYESASARGRREGYYNAEYKTTNPAVPEMLAAGECADGAGVLEIQPDGYGFLRAENCLPGPNDVYISIAQIRRFCLREGDYVEGKTRPQREGDRYSAMMYINAVNGEPPEAAAARPRFEDLVPIYPDERLKLEPALRPEGSGKADLSLRLVDMLAPIGKGQRGMIVSQPKAGKTTLLKKIANAITTNYPEVRLIVLLIDERPEEVTDMKRSIDGEVIYSTFDEAPENHVRVSEMVLARAQRLTEMGKDVVVLMDSITRLARAYNLVITPTGRSLSGGLDPGALFKPKRFFGAARNIENGGSLTVIATALVETGSRMDDIIFEEFKGTGNMELHLDRKLSDRRVFPAIDMVRSGTRREELLLTEAEQDGEMLVRRMLSGGRGQEMAEQIIDLMSKTGDNAEFFERLKGWLAVFEKEGYTFGGK